MNENQPLPLTPEDTNPPPTPSPSSHREHLQPLRGRLHRGEGVAGVDGAHKGAWPLDLHHVGHRLHVQLGSSAWQQVPAMRAAGRQNVREGPPACVVGSRSGRVAWCCTRAGVQQAAYLYRSLPLVPLLPSRSAAAPSALETASTPDAVALTEHPTSAAPRRSGLPQARPAGDPGPRHLLSARRSRPPEPRRRWVPPPGPCRRRGG